MDTCCSPSEEKINGFSKWEVEDAVRTLERAEEIKNDAKLMDALQPFLEKKVAAIKSIAQLRAVASKKILAEQEKDKK